MIKSLNMKLKSALVIAAILLYSVAVAQTGKEFKCYSSRYDDEHTGDLKFNRLIDSACIEINAGNYEKGYKLLTEALYTDSINSNGIINNYIDGQRKKLKIFIDQKNDHTSPDEQASVSSEANEAKKDKTESAAFKKSKKHKKEDVKEPASSPMPEKSGSSQTPLETTPNPEPVKEEITIKESNTPPPPEEKKEEIKTGSNPGSLDNSSSTSKSFTEEELGEFHNKGQQKVLELEGHIKQIGSKSTDLSTAMEATENAIILFDTENHTVQVSSINKPDKNKFKIRKYLERLRLLPHYNEVEIEWANFQYASEFRKGPDGNYYGYITFRQRFTARTDVKVQYEDYTDKKIEVILKRYAKSVEGAPVENWEVFLGDISVMQTSKN